MSAPKKHLHQTVNPFGNPEQKAKPGKKVKRKRKPRKKAARHG